MKIEYIKLCGVSELEEKKGRLFKIDDENEVALFKINGKVHAVDNICPHNHTPKIYKGIIEDDCVLCPIHFFKFNLKTGKPIEFTGGNLRIYETKIENSIVFIKKPDAKTFNFDF